MFQGISFAQPRLGRRAASGGLLAANSGPPLIVRLIYFQLIGWWFGFAWLACALFLFLPIITAPLAIWMLIKTPKAFLL
jgi:uncharacterized membrane protein YccF (DUF307 family)